MIAPRWWRSVPAGVFTAVLATTGCVVGLDLLFGFLELAGKGESGYTIATRLLEDLPDRLRRLLPQTCLIGAVWHMGSLALHGELGALRALGVSGTRICLMAAMPVLLFSTLVLSLTEISAPAEEWEDGRRLHWSRADNLVLLSSGCDRPLRWWRMTGGDLQSWGSADSACHQDGRWQMSQVQRWNTTMPEPVQMERWSLAVSEPPPPSERANPRKLGLGQIWQTQQTLPDNRYRSALLLEFFSRLAAPLKIALLVLAATLLPLAMLRDARPGVRLVAALGLAMGFYLAETVAYTLGQNLQLPPALLAAIPPLALAFLFPLLLRRYAL